MYRYTFPAPKKAITLIKFGNVNFIPTDSEYNNFCKFFSKNLITIDSSKKSEYCQVTSYKDVSKSKCDYIFLIESKNEVSTKELVIWENLINSFDNPNESILIYGYSYSIKRIKKSFAVLI